MCEEFDVSETSSRVHLPTTDGRHLTLPRHTQPTRDRRLLLDQLKLRLPEQPPPRISV